MLLFGSALHGSLQHGDAAAVPAAGDVHDAGYPAATPAAAAAAPTAAGEAARDNYGAHGGAAAAPDVPKAEDPAGGKQCALPRADEERADGADGAAAT